MSHYAPSFEPDSRVVIYSATPPNCIAQIAMGPQAGDVPFELEIECDVCGKKHSFSHRTSFDCSTPSALKSMKNYCQQKSIPLFEKIEESN